MPAAVAATLSREPMSIEESLENVGKQLNTAILNKLTSLKIPVWHNPEAVVGALVALDYSVETKVQQTETNSWIPVAEFVEITLRW